MVRLVKMLAKEFVLGVPVLREKYFEREFLRREQSFRGLYPTFQAASAAAPAGILEGYNHPEIARIDEANLENLNRADYPLLFWLSRLLPENKNVFDLGGNLGVAYYAYRRYLSYPVDLCWMVCEVSETAAAGREMAAARGIQALHFTDRREDARGAEIYFTCGALQYIEEAFAEILGQLPSLPRHVLINRVPLCDGDSFVTLQNNGKWIVPYRVVNEAKFVQSLVTLGYECVDRWKTHRSLRVLSPGEKGGEYQGMYFRLAGANSGA